MPKNCCCSATKNRCCIAKKKPYTFAIDPEEFQKWSKFTTDYIINYFETIDKRRVIPDVKPGFLRPLLPTEAPQDAGSWEEIMADLEKIIMPGITHWQHPHFHAYFPSAATYPGIIADMIIGSLGAMGFTWASCPSLTELEYIMLDWLGKALGLPAQFLHSETNGEGGGALTASASECVLTAMLAARKQGIEYIRNAEKFPKETHDCELMSRIVGYTSSEAHSCVEKAAMMAAVRMRIIPADENGRLPPELLKVTMEEDKAKGLHPVFVFVTIGTTGSTAFDSVKDIAPVVQEYPACWIHADLAYGGAMFVCPEMRGPMEGFEHLDSLNFNPNKWLLINYDCSTLYTKSIKKITKGMVVNPTYLEHAEETQDLRHWGIHLSRRFRSLKIWFTLRIYGIKNLQDYIRNHCALAKEFETLVRSDSRFEVLNTVNAGLVVFRLKGSGDELTINLLAKINAVANIHMVPSRIREKYAIRFSVNYERATKEHIEFAWNEITKQAEEVIQDFNQAQINKPKKKTLTSRYSFAVNVPRDHLGRASMFNLTDGASPLLVETNNDDEDFEGEFKNRLNLS